MDERFKVFVVGAIGCIGLMATSPNSSTTVGVVFATMAWLIRSPTGRRWIGMDGDTEKEPRD